MTIQTDKLVEADTALRSGKVLVATGPAIRKRFESWDNEVSWYVDPAEPDRLWCALAPYFPGWLWVPVAPEPAVIDEVLGGMFPKQRLSRIDFTRHERGFVGYIGSVRVPHVYSGAFVEFNGHDLDRYYTGVEFVEHGMWGSAHLDDPLTDDSDMVSPIVMLAASNEGRSGQQMLGRVPSMTWRTVHSRSYVSFEIHFRKWLCVRVSYRPAPASHHAVVAKCNELLQSSLPLDMPLDVVGALSGFWFGAEADLIKNVTEAAHPGQLAAGLEAMAALADGDLERMLLLREYAKHPDQQVRRTVLSLANWYHLAFLLYDVALASDDDPEALEVAEALLDRGTDLDNTNVFADHFDAFPMFVDEQGNGHEARQPADMESDDDED
jgi:hypothetical protein